MFVRSPRLKLPRSVVRDCRVSAIVHRRILPLQHGRGTQWDDVQPDTAVSAVPSLFRAPSDSAGDSASQLSTQPLDDPFAPSAGPALAAAPPQALHIMSKVDVDTDDLPAAEGPSPPPPVGVPQLLSLGSGAARPVPRGADSAADRAASADAKAQVDAVAAVAAAAAMGTGDSGHVSDGSVASQPATADGDDGDDAATKAVRGCAVGWGEHLGSAAAVSAPYQAPLARGQLCGVSYLPDDDSDDRAGAGRATPAGWARAGAMVNVAVKPSRAPRTLPVLAIHYVEAAELRKDAHLSYVSCVRVFVVAAPPHTCVSSCFHRRQAMQAPSGRRGVGVSIHK